MWFGCWMLECTLIVIYLNFLQHVGEMIWAGQGLKHIKGTLNETVDVAGKDVAQLEADTTESIIFETSSDYSRLLAEEVEGTGMEKVHVSI